MRQIGAFEAKTHLSELLAEVEAGDSILITRRGTPVARLVPPVRNRNAALARLASLRGRLAARNVGLTAGDILSARDEGRR
ncbi:type II toxin-antitoxin system prevent-host-death family antitoxin [uncultured Paracoccus sp.]|uniref:type II toxin-antitoxin system Phd/YefM family antitoxin n=1 Tax=uncultured Paracoccus sp. TaxID=189685 RepID=UPI00260551ED|nr:type II toxin-antitoxin system prevent-host-death family antitoxin [uncultured Paracoccus sp.]